MVHPESPSAPSRFETRTGVTLAELAQQCHRLLFLLQEQEPPSWDELAAGEQAKWLECLEPLCELISQEIETKFSVLGSRLSAAYYAADRWSSLSDKEKQAWIICVRHVVNLVTAEDADDVKDAMEFDWVQWTEGG